MPAIDANEAIHLKPLSLHELCEVLVRHFGLTEGQFDLLVNYQVGTGMFGPETNQAGPGIAVSIQQIGLAPSTTPNHVTVDASKITKRKKKSAQG